LGYTSLFGCLGDECNACVRASSPMGTELGAHGSWLWCGDRRVCISHHRHGDHSALDDEIRLGTEELRIPQHKVCKLANFDRAHFIADTMGDRRIDGVLGNVSLNPVVVVVGTVISQGTTLVLHGISHLPGA